MRALSYSEDTEESARERKARLEREALEAEAETRRSLMPLALTDFIHAVSPQLDPPMHLAWWCGQVEACLKGGVRALMAVPIRHYKTVTTLHGIAWLLLHDPEMRIILMCADHTRASELAKMCKKICEAACVGPMRGESVHTDWRNEDGGGVTCMSAKQSKQGKDVDVLIFDDPLSEHDAYDAMVKDAADTAIANYTARAGRTGARAKRGSVLGLMSRWDLDDPIGRRELRRDWLSMRCSAIVDEGLPSERAFAEEVMTLEEIKARRRELCEADPSERTFHAQFMNNPLPPMLGGFGDPARYHGEPPTYPGFRYAMGLDMAYKPGEQNDYFALVVLKIYQDAAYLVDCVRLKTEFVQLESLIRNRWDRYGRCPMFSYISGVEVGAMQYFMTRGIPIQGMPARFNKSVRAQYTKDMWNAGKIIVPAEASWAPGVIARFKRFSGSDKARDDDEIDALVSVMDGMRGHTGPGGRPRAFGKPRV